MARKGEEYEVENRSRVSVVPNEIGVDDADDNGDGRVDPLEERKELIEDLFEKAEAYAKTNMELLKLRAADKLSEIVASLVSRIIIIVFFSLFFLMVNIGLATWLGEITGHVYYGFFIVAGLYLVIALFIYAFRKKIIKDPIIDGIISQILK